MDVKKMMAEKAKFTPPPGGGFNLVGVDTYADPGEALYFVENYPTREAAEAAKKKREKETGETLYVYGPAEE